MLLRDVYQPAGAVRPVAADLRGLLLAVSAWFLSVRHTVADDVVVDTDAREGEAPVPTHEREVVSD